jgi:predicted DNA-binding transcriptional regulator AlpA
VATASKQHNGEVIPRPRVGELLTIPQVIDELGVPRSTFYRWRQLGTGPLSIKLHNGQIRIRRSALVQWLADLEDGTR